MKIVKELGSFWVKERSSGHMLCNYLPCWIFSVVLLLNPAVSSSLFCRPGYLKVFHRFLSGWPTITKIFLNSTYQKRCCCFFTFYFISWYKTNHLNNYWWNIMIVTDCCCCRKLISWLQKWYAMLFLKLTIAQGVQSREKSLFNWLLKTIAKEHSLLMWLIWLKRSSQLFLATNWESLKNPVLLLPIRGVLLSKIVRCICFAYLSSKFTFMISIWRFLACCCPDDCAAGSAPQVLID